MKLKITNPKNGATVSVDFPFTYTLSTQDWLALHPEGGAIPNATVDYVLGLDHTFAKPERINVVGSLATTGVKVTIN